MEHDTSGSGFDPPAQTSLIGGLALIAALCCGSMAFAQSSTSTSTSGSSATVDVNSEATASAVSGQGGAGGSVYIAGAPSQTRSVIEQRGTTTIRSAPAVQAPSMGSGHPCALSGSVGISIIGGGVSGGAMKIDEACLLAQMGQGEAALIMIARRDSEACFALRATGRIPASSQCNGDERRAAARQPAQAAAAPPVACVRDGNGRVIRIMKQRGVTEAAARSFCGR